MQVAFLITAHMPYLRRSGRQPIGEEPLHELIAHGLLPLLGLLSELQATGLPVRVALACSPLLVEQLADPVVQKHFVLWMDAAIARREAELQRFESEGDSHRSYLARFYLEWQRQTLRAFEERYQRDLPKKLRELAASRLIEPLASTASHAYLPLLRHEETVRAQVEHGLLHTIRHQGRPEGLWLAGGGWRPGLEQAIAEVELHYVLADPRCLDGLSGRQPVWLLPRRLAAVFADEGLAEYISSPQLGYVGDPLYRDHRSAGGYAAIGLGVGAAQPYDPYHALRRAQEHATHFTSLLVAERERSGPDELRVIAIDLQTLGTRWFEGPTWLQATLTLCATHPALTLTTPGPYLRRQRPRQAATLGAVDHRAWLGPASQGYWQDVGAVEERMIALARAYPSAEHERERALNQAARELLLAQTSDWPALLAAGGVSERWRTYLGRFAQLASMAEENRLDASERFLLEQLEDVDGPFPSLNYRIFS